MIGEKMPGRKVPRVGRADLDEITTSVVRRIATNGRNRCIVLIDDAGFVRVRSAYLPFRRTIPKEWIVGSYNHNTPPAAIRVALANKIQETTK